jgi:hypothetical protein
VKTTAKKGKNNPVNGVKNICAGFAGINIFVEIFFMDISGKIIQFLPVQTGSGKNGTWKKQEFILETGDTYPKKVCIAVWGDKIDIASFKAGETINVSFDVESREYNGKWYTDVKAWKVAAGKGAEGGSSAAAPQAAPAGDFPSGDDLPF